MDVDRKTIDLLAEDFSKDFLTCASKYNNGNWKYVGMLLKGTNSEAMEQIRERVASRIGSDYEVKIISDMPELQLIELRKLGYYTVDTDYFLNRFAKVV